MASTQSDQAPIPAAPTECDLVMQGGITSGVAYPAAVIELHKHFRFRSIGGASAGAMAAAVTAAAEYARDSGGFQRLEALRAELRTPGLIAGLFRPTRDAAPLFRILLGAQAKHTDGAKAMTYLWGLVRWLFLPALLSGAAAFGLGVVLVHSAGGTLGGLGVLGWVVFSFGVLVTAALGLVVALGWSVRGLVKRMPANNFGMVPGAKQRPADADALTDWLHKKIQHIAGRAEDDPLTFEDLLSRGVDLQLMTTDVTGGRPVRMPNGSHSGVEYLFSVDELRPLVPKPVLDFLARTCPVRYPEAGQLRALPGGGMPVLLAARISLAFPVMLSAVPLWTVKEQGVARHWFADGGISSNFPIQFFDAWLPTRPTFGLYFGAPIPPTGRPEPQRPQRLPDPTKVVGYLHSILLAGMNWHDTLQAQLPGFRDRVVPIPLSDGEGGFNLTMPPDMIADVDAKGAAAGRQLAAFDFHRHWLDRYALTMRMVQRNLSRPHDGRVSFREAYTEQYGRWFAEGAPGTELPEGVTAVWCGEAAEATSGLLASSCAWLPSGESFVDGQDPLPPMTMRITPDV
ncbi:patatin-like phospholipase family protein [Kutzneria albida]|uniref:PNPLA domain-containing protein n=1 Tax=Kutzneria albida DSM 43870 TaxID=1449976 RepID=W5WG56_9PSEU|nr:patatin-like phospholipase family protein [Kutzneria albida]AHI00164.1 hypothetical protein KALB_6805 [Kutzneria albida DSM 43870]